MMPVVAHVCEQKIEAHPCEEFCGGLLLWRELSLVKEQNRKHRGISLEHIRGALALVHGEENQVEQLDGAELTLSPQGNQAPHDKCNIEESCMDRVCERVKTQGRESLFDLLRRRGVPEHQRHRVHAQDPVQAPEPSLTQARRMELPGKHDLIFKGIRGKSCGPAMERDIQLEPRDRVGQEACVCRDDVYTHHVDAQEFERGGMTVELDPSVS